MRGVREYKTHGDREQLEAEPADFVGKLVRSMSSVFALFKLQTLVVAFVV